MAEINGYGGSVAHGLIEDDSLSLCNNPPESPSCDSIKAPPDSMNDQSVPPLPPPLPLNASTTSVSTGTSPALVIPSIPMTPNTLRKNVHVRQNCHRRFDSVEEYVTTLGGNKKCFISKILISNNGVAAVKAIRSIRRWAYEVFGNERAIQFVVMATPEDLRANAEYIRMGDVIVDVPGGSNNHNYANVTLIVELARLHGVHSVWAGWGHASEKPSLPDTLHASNPPIKFIGPAGPPMRALGDKIGSTIIAQSAGVPCIAWNGMHIKATYDKETGTLPQQAFDDACITTVAQAQQAANAIGFPIMIKASEGGGGKGIRRVDHADDVANAYRQVCGEVPGSPIFIMKLSSNSRHLEVQVLADEYGNAVALNGRDCSVQRRHQKIIEEGPPIAAVPEVWTEMEKAAVALAKAVQYANAGTVEYLYSELTEKFYFLELNPRLQVEHPVTEMITRVNLPAAQLQVAMGIPLHNIPEIRELYGRNRFEDDPLCESSMIDFETTPRNKPIGHCIAVRITAENAEAGFKPTSGGIQDLNFRSTPNVWGYFSMDSSGSIHEFADSQFGHLFANGADREQARRNMVLALKELSIRGDISTTVDYISKLIELDDFVSNHIDTSWLDTIIKENIEGMGTAEEILHNTHHHHSGRHSTTTALRRSLSVNMSPLHTHMYVVMGATILAYDTSREGEKRFLELLDKGQLPPARSLLKMKHNIELILGGIKFRLCCMRSAATSYCISLQDDIADDNNDDYDDENMNSNMSVMTNVRLLSDGGYLIDIGGNSHVAYLTSKGDAAQGMRLNVGGKNIIFSPDYDPTALRTDVAGKLVKKLKADGAHVKKGEPYCEIEVMKMFMPLKVEESGILRWCTNEGASIAAGDLLATLDLENPENVSTVTTHTGPLQVVGWVKTGTTHNDNNKGNSVNVATADRPHLLLRDAIEKLDCAMSGYLLSSDAIENALSTLAIAVTQPTLPVYEILDSLSALSGRIPTGLFDTIQNMLQDFQNACMQQKESGVELRFPAEEILTLIDKCATESYKDAAERAAFHALTAPLRATTVPYAKSKLAGVPGSERALQHFLTFLRKWITNERWFCDGKTYADAVENLRRAHKADASAVLNACRAHLQVCASTEIVIRIISIIGDGSRIDFLSQQATTPSAIGKRVSIVAGAESLPTAMSVISEIGSMGLSDDYCEVALRARKLLMQESMPSLEQRRQKVLNAAKSLSFQTVVAPPNTESILSREAEALIADHIPMSDVFLPLLQSVRSTEDEVGLTELYLRHLYRPYTLKEFVRDTEKRMVRFSFLNKPSEVVINAATSVNSMTDLSRIVSSGSLSRMSDMSDSSMSANQENSTTNILQYENRIPQSTVRTGAAVIVDHLEELADTTKFESILQAFPEYSNEFGPTNVLYFTILDTFVGPDEEDAVKRCEAILQPYQQQLRNADMRRVSFIFNQEKNQMNMEQYDDFQDFVPALFTFRFPEFREDSLYRRIDPSLAVHLHLNRIAANFRIRSLGSRHTSTCHVHLYECTPRTSSLARDRKANKLPRIFARALSFSLEFSSSGFERILVDALNALDLCSMKCKTDNHLFLNLVSDFERTVLDPVVVEQVVVAILKRHGERVLSLGIVEVETRIVCCLSLESPPIAIRLFASNPTGYVHVMNTYVEAVNEADGERVFKLVSGTKASLASAGDSSWDGLAIDTPYPLTRPFDAQRKAALLATDTVYCYDIPALFEAAVEQQWLEYSAARGNNSGLDGSGCNSIRTVAATAAINANAPGRPLMVMYTMELVVQQKNGPNKDCWTMRDYMNGDLELVQINGKRAGSNNVGMVAWLLSLKTVEYPNGRQVVLIANDITFKAGSFGTREDVVFKMASEFAREKRIPRIFIAANSGARIGLAERVKATFKVSFKQPNQPENGFHFLYVTKDDYEILKNNKEIIAEPMELNGEEVYKITDIIGTEPDLGVENLKGSGLIAGETSSAYDDIFTMTVVLGRTVGIGAYLVRLGQRTIQKASASPIILTGYQALNKLMGVDVYSTNDQLGGPGIMYSNGVSHLVEPDHLHAVKAAIDWLSFVPSVRGGLLPVSDIRGIDEIERPIGFTPMKGVPYDPRLLLSGGEDDSGTWQSGFFDRGSFRETLAGWAKTVVVGRARLGGIPMGVVITENRTAENIKPADPADVKASEAVIQEAGCVWFPNSAYKTAQAIKDFRTEDLPLIVFANWRGFSGGQRDMFDEVLKYGSLIVDAFVSYQQPVFVFIPPHAEIRGGAWVVLDASINASVMEMYAAKDTARGGVLEANGAASVKYRSNDVVATMHRLDEKLQQLDAQLASLATTDVATKKSLLDEVKKREQMLLPVYEQIAVQFCELHDTPGRMKAVGVIEKEVEWENARSFFYWRLRRKLAEFDLRKQLIDAGEVGRGAKVLTPIQATAVVKKWFLDSPNMTEDMWQNDKIVLAWMAGHYGELERSIANFSKEVITQEVFQVMTAGGRISTVGITGIAEGVGKALSKMSANDRDLAIQMFQKMLDSTK